jgi:hypothetical protein
MKSFKWLTELETYEMGNKSQLAPIGSIANGSGIRAIISLIESCPDHRGQN